MSAAGESGLRAPGAFVPPSFTSGKISYGEQSSLEAAMAACGVVGVAPALGQRSVRGWAWAARTVWLVRGRYLLEFLEWFRVYALCPGLRKADPTRAH